MYTRSPRPETENCAAIKWGSDDSFQDGRRLARHFQVFRSNGIALHFKWRDVLAPGYILDSAISNIDFASGQEYFVRQSRGYEQMEHHEEEHYDT